MTERLKQRRVTQKFGFAGAEICPEECYPLSASFEACSKGSWYKLEDPILIVIIISEESRRGTLLT